MIKLREEDMSKAETDWKPGLLHLTVSQAVTAKTDAMTYLERYSESNIYDDW